MSDNATVIIGMQYGDEGKGKITDFFSEKADLVVRFNGGNNAGHTVVVGEKKFKFHLLPSGLVYGKKCAIGAGCAIDPRVLAGEIKNLGKEISLVIDPRAQIIMPWHNLLDGVSEQKMGEKKIGTTGRGIGPCYSDRASRTGIRFADLINETRFKEKLKAGFATNKNILEKLYGFKADEDFLEKKILAEYSALAKFLSKYAGDVSLEVHNAIASGKNVLLEGAQGTFLDNDFGTYPFVTSSHPLTGAAMIGIGLGPKTIGRVIGVLKAYTTRVGGGPFVTELDNELGEKIRVQGGEFGTTTGRPRRVGWLDLVLARTSLRLNGVDEIVLTKIDVLSGFEELFVCTEYECNGKKIMDVPADIENVYDCKPVFKKFSGFKISGNEKSFSELDRNAQDYVSFIEKELGTKISMVSTGAERNKIIMR